MRSVEKEHRSEPHKRKGFYRHCIDTHPCFSIELLFSYLTQKLILIEGKTEGSVI